MLSGTPGAQPGHILAPLKHTDLPGFGAAPRGGLPDDFILTLLLYPLLEVAVRSNAAHHGRVKDQYTHNAVAVAAPGVNDTHLAASEETATAGPTRKQYLPGPLVPCIDRSEHSATVILFAPVVTDLDPRAVETLTPACDDFVVADLTAQVAAFDFTASLVPAGYGDDAIALD